MTDLLDSVNKQYPIGSLLVWETPLKLATLDKRGPFRFARAAEPAVGYLLDGHQRLSTLAGALVSRDAHEMDPDEEDPGRWDLVWNMAAERFQHGSALTKHECRIPAHRLVRYLDLF